MTNVIIDKLIHPTTGEILATVTIDLDEVGLTAGRNPTGLPDPVTMLQYLAWLNGNVPRQTQAGWRSLKQLPGEAVPSHPWARLVVAANAAGAPAAVKALGLA